MVEKGDVVWRKRSRAKGLHLSHPSHCVTGEEPNKQTASETLGPSKPYAGAGIGNYPRYQPPYFNCPVRNLVTSLIRC